MNQLSFSKRLNRLSIGSGATSVQRKTTRGRTVATMLSLSLGACVIDASAFTEYVEENEVVTGEEIPNGQEQFVYGTAKNTIVNANSSQVIGSGGVASATILRDYGAQLIQRGGKADGTVVNADATQTVMGEATGTRVKEWSAQKVYGTVRDTTVSGGRQLVFQNGVASATILEANGSQTINPGGRADGTVVNGGNMSISSKGAASKTIINAGGFMEIFREGEGDGTTVNAGGGQLVRGVETRATVNKGGVQKVYGTVSDTTVSGGHQVVFPGGVGIDGSVKSDGIVTADRGSVLRGYKVDGANAQVGADGEVSASQNGGLALSVSGSRNGVVLTGARLMAGVEYLGSDNTLNIEGGTLFDGDVMLNDKTRSNDLTLLRQNLTLANNTGAGVFVLNWKNFTIGSDASVDMAGSALTLLVGKLSNDGALTVGPKQTLKVDGDYSQTGSLVVGVDNPATYGKTVVTGKATLSKTAQIVIAPRSVLAPYTTYGDVFRASGNTTGSFVPNGTYGRLQYSIVPNGDAFDLVTKTFLPEAAGLTPLLYGGQVMLTLNQAHASLQRVRNRIDHMNGAPDQRTTSDVRAWVAPFVNTSRQGGGGHPSAAYKQKTGGFALGAEAPFGDNLSMGVAATIGKTSVRGQNLATNDSLTTTSYQFTGYAKQAIGEASQLSFIVHGALDKNRSNRLATANGISQNASARYGGWHGMLSAEANHRWQFGGTTLTPLVRLDYGYAKVNSYNEHGTDSSNLNVSRQKGKILVVSVGGRAKYDINETSNFSVRALLGYDFASKTNTLTATDVNGIAFTAASNRADPRLTQIGVSYEIKPTKDRFRLRANYDYFGRGNGHHNGLISFNLYIPF